MSVGYLFIWISK